MCVGVALGATVFPERLKGVNSNLTIASTGLLIFSMGSMLGGRPDFMNELATIGLASVAFAVVPIVFSVVLVYVLSNALMSDITKRHAREREEKLAEGNKEARAASNSGEAAMIAIAVGALVTGVAYGLSGLALMPLDLIGENSTYILWALLLFVGISVGSSKGLMGKIREYHVRVLIVPFGIVVGTVAAGILLAPLFGMHWAVGGAVASGLGWYSLSGVLLTQIAGAQVGGITFLSCLLRELISFFAIPWIARHLNYPTCIAPAAATSEDTTLPMLISCTNGETVVLAVVNGVICSALVPVLIEVFHWFM